jgi:hypothetical protein
MVIDRKTPNDYLYILWAREPVPKVTSDRTSVDVVDNVRRQDDSVCVLSYSHFIVILLRLHVRQNEKCHHSVLLFVVLQQQQQQHL